MFPADVAKLYQDVAFVAVVVHVCCKLLFSVFHLFFHTYVAVCLFGCCICLIYMLQVFLC
jgi:hypothetical protein